MMTFSARAFGKGKAIALRAMVPMVSEKAPRTWIHLAMEGVWEGHPAGPFEFTTDVFRRIIANFDDQANPIPLTYEHPERDHGQPVPAAGWIHAMEIRHGADGAELWADVEFTQRAAKMIREGEYKFCSVVVVFESEDRETADEIGPELFEVGLTNTPFLDGQQPIHFSARTTTARNPNKGTHAMALDPEKVLSSVAKALGLPEDADRAMLVKALDAVASLKEALSGEAGAPAEEAPAPAAEASDKPEDATECSDTADNGKAEAKADDEAEPKAKPKAPPFARAATVKAADELPLQDEELGPEAQGAAAGDVLTLLQELTGLDEAGILASLQENGEAVAAALLGGALGSGGEAEAEGLLTDVAAARERAHVVQLVRRDKQIAELTARIDAMADANTEREIDEAINAGHILDTDKAKFVELAKKAPELLATFLGRASADPAVPTGAKTKSGPPVSAGLSDIADTDPLYELHNKALKHVIKDKTRRDKIIREAIHNQQKNGRA